MLKFFRRIRRKLLSQGNTRKYILYATGEIFLVVIGILIALQINNWSGSIKDKAAEKSYLESLKADLVSDTINLNQVLEQVALNLDAANTLITYFNETEKEAMDTDKIYSSIRLAGFLTYFETNSATFDDLKSTGNIKVISNLELKKAISSYYNFIESKKNYRNLWQDKVWGEYWEARDDLINDQLKAHWSNTFYRNQKLENLPKDFNISKEDARYFIQSLYNIVDMTTFRESIYKDIKEKAQELIEEVALEIDDR